MERTALHDKRGMTLIEIMIAVVLLAIVAVALLQSSIVVMNNNIKNELRDEAVNVAEQRMNEIRNIPFADLATGPTSTTITRNIRGMINFPFTATLTPNVIDTNSKQETILITWTYRGLPYNHSVSTVLRSNTK